MRHGSIFFCMDVARLKCSVCIFLLTLFILVIIMIMTYLYFMLSCVMMSHLNDINHLYGQQGDTSQQKRDDETCCFNVEPVSQTVGLP